VLAGIMLRLWQYAGGTAMWLDELAVVDNVLERSPWRLLTEPLAWNQAAPKGFLLAEKLSAAIFGRSDYGLRIFPLLCGIFGLLLFAHLARKALSPAGALAAVTLFAFAGPLIDYGSRAKQYSSDVTVSVLMLWLAWDVVNRRFSSAAIARAAILGAIAVWFSLPAVLMLAALGLVLIAQASRAQRGAVLQLVACWCVAALAAALAGLAAITPETRHYLNGYWVHGFPPASFPALLRARWPLGELAVLAGSGSDAGMAYPFPNLFLFLGVVGAAALWVGRRGLALLLVAPITAALAAAVVRQYPFSDRMVLFLFPSFLLLLAAGMEALYGAVAKVSQLAAWAALALLLLAVVYPVLKLRPPYRIEDMKPVLAHLQQNRREHDAVFVYYGAVPAVRFYGVRYGLPPDAYSSGGCHKGDTRQYLRELDPFRGNPRVWVLITAAHPRWGEGDDIVRYLDTIGTVGDSMVIPSRTVGAYSPPAEAFLFNLSVPEKLAQATAESFRLQGPGDSRPCQYGPYAMAQ
jgi:hypothetical protein